MWSMNNDIISPCFSIHFPQLRENKIKNPFLIKPFITVLRIKMSVPAARILNTESTSAKFRLSPYPLGWLIFNIRIFALFPDTQSHHLLVKTLLWQHIWQVLTLALMIIPIYSLFFKIFYREMATSFESVRIL